MNFLFSTIIYDEDLVYKIDPWYFKDLHLQVACAYGKYRVVAYLASKGLNVNSCTYSGRSCLSIALNSNMMSEQDRVKTVETLLFYGADPNENLGLFYSYKIKRLMSIFIGGSKYQEITNEMMTDKVNHLL
jgi:hypothetical protein